jgi:hypothetical protein
VSVGAVAASRRRATAATNKITNGDFTGGTTGWTGFGYSGKSVAAGKGVFAATPTYDPISQSVTYEVGKYYEATFTISAYVSGSPGPALLGGTNRDGTTRTADGTYTERLLANTGNNVFAIRGYAGTGTFQVDDVSLIGPYDTSTVGGP